MVATSPKVEYWRYSDAAAAVKLCRRTLERAVAAGRLPVLRHGRAVRFRPADVLSWFERYGSEGGAK